ncbi:hypothetical protein GQ473_00940 [archaeon]|nr:hypothetical protein [archaeon]
MGIEKVLSIVDYYKYRINREGFKYIFELTSSKYPRVLSLGVCYLSTKDIVICKVLNWKLRLEHERGHAKGLVHTMKIGYVMNPYGILRGARYLATK